MEKLLTFKRFHTEAQAAEIVTLLQAHNIPVAYEEEVLLMDHVYVGQNFDQRHLVKIPAGYFTQADNLLKSMITVSPEDVEPDYYLLSFTTEELKDVIAQKDEWGDFDYALALKLLEKQGITYTPEQLHLLGNKRLETLTKPQELPGHLVLIGYLSPLLLFVPFPYMSVFSCLGIFIGAFVRLTKKTLPDGSRVYAFSDSTREQGKWMVLITTLLLCLCWLVLVKVIYAQQ
ncbi:hypothetical protein SAMN05444266_101195 [Chitinophaga jiangningensis]|uniref:Uncharacterized protein n=1 Tax=Chitinophaga jiangningensis TaxID=1419482 RepID=A0A1M6VGA1_9BACT|nr:hypothetical protein [Chitinophaga jiangningensis]SHK80533.1 hypothetical protein SAMN05444266_101195 [Chitinophaga jiangningensis]